MKVIQLDKACRTLMKHIVAVIAILAPLGGIEAHWCCKIAVSCIMVRIASVML